LAKLGIAWSRVHLDRLQQAGKLPRMIKLGYRGATASRAFIREEIAA
jgi:hypothetical protein